MKEGEVNMKAYWCSYYIALTGYLTGEASDRAGHWKVLGGNEWWAWMSGFGELHTLVYLAEENDSWKTAEGFSM